MASGLNVRLRTLACAIRRLGRTKCESFNVSYFGAADEKEPIAARAHNDEPFRVDGAKLEGGSGNRATDQYLNLSVRASFRLPRGFNRSRAAGCRREHGETSEQWTVLF